LTSALWIIGVLAGAQALTVSLVLQWWTLAAVLAAGWTCGEYSGRTYRESRKRPEYLVDASIRWDNPTETPAVREVNSMETRAGFTGYHTPAEPPATVSLPGRQRPAWAPVRRA
jgi:hypothetical protein